MKIIQVTNQAELIGEAVVSLSHKLDANRQDMHQMDSNMQHVHDKVQRLEFDQENVLAHIQDHLHPDKMDELFNKVEELDENSKTQEMEIVNSLNQIVKQHNDAIDERFDDFSKKYEDDKKTVRKIVETMMKDREANGQQPVTYEYLAKLTERLHELENKKQQYDEEPVIETFNKLTEGQDEKIADMIVELTANPFDVQSYHVDQLFTRVDKLETDNDGEIFSKLSKEQDEKFASRFDKLEANQKDLNSHVVDDLFTRVDKLETDNDGELFSKLSKEQDEKFANRFDKLEAIQKDLQSQVVEVLMTRVDKLESDKVGEIFAKLSKQQDDKFSARFDKLEAKQKDMQDKLETAKDSVQSLAKVSNQPEEHREPLAPQQMVNDLVTRMEKLESTQKDVQTLAKVPKQEGCALYKPKSPMPSDEGASGSVEELKKLQESVQHIQQQQTDLDHRVTNTNVTAALSDLQHKFKELQRNHNNLDEYVQSAHVAAEFSDLHEKVNKLQNQALKDLDHPEPKEKLAQLERMVKDLAAKHEVLNTSLDNMDVMSDIYGLEHKIEDLTALITPEKVSKIEQAVERLVDLPAKYEGLREEFQEWKSHGRIETDEKLVKLLDTVEDLQQKQQEIHDHVHNSDLPAKFEGLQNKFDELETRVSPDANQKISTLEQNVKALEENQREFQDNVRNTVVPADITELQNKFEALQTRVDPESNEHFAKLADTVKTLAKKHEDLNELANPEKFAALEKTVKNLQEQKESGNVSNTNAEITDIKAKIIDLQTVTNPAKISELEEKLQKFTQKQTEFTDSEIKDLRKQMGDLQSLANPDKFSQLEEQFQEFAKNHGSLDNVPATITDLKRQVDDVQTLVTPEFQNKFAEVEETVKDLRQKNYELDEKVRTTNTPLLTALQQKVAEFEKLVTPESFGELKETVAQLQTTVNPNEIVRVQEALEQLAQKQKDLTQRVDDTNLSKEVLGLLNKFEDFEHKHKTLEANHLELVDKQKSFDDRMPTAVHGKFVDLSTRIDDVVSKQEVGDNDSQEKVKQLHELLTQLQNEVREHAAAMKSFPSKEDIAYNFNKIMEVEDLVSKLEQLRELDQPDLDYLHQQMKDSEEHHESSQSYLDRLSQRVAQIENALKLHPGQLLSPRNGSQNDVGSVPQPEAVRELIQKFEDKVDELKSSKNKQDLLDKQLAAMNEQFKAFRHDADQMHSLAKTPKAAKPGISVDDLKNRFEKIETDLAKRVENLEKKPDRKKEVYDTVHKIVQQHDDAIDKRLDNLSTKLEDDKRSILASLQELVKERMQNGLPPLTQEHLDTFIKRVEEVEKKQQYFDEKPVVETFSKLTKQLEEKQVSAINELATRLEKLESGTKDAQSLAKVANQQHENVENIASRLDMLETENKDMQSLVKVANQQEANVDKIATRLDHLETSLKDAQSKVSNQEALKQVGIRLDQLESAQKAAQSAAMISKQGVASDQPDAQILVDEVKRMQARLAELEKKNKSKSNLDDAISSNAESDQDTLISAPLRSSDAGNSSSPAAITKGRSFMKFPTFKKAKKVNPDDVNQLASRVDKLEAARKEALSSANASKQQNPQQDIPHQDQQIMMDEFKKMQLRLEQLEAKQESESHMNDLIKRIEILESRAQSPQDLEQLMSRFDDMESKYLSVFEELDHKIDKKINQKILRLDHETQEREAELLHTLQQDQQKSREASFSSSQQRYASSQHYASSEHAQVAGSSQQRYASSQHYASSEHAQLAASSQPAAASTPSPRNLIEEEGEKMFSWMAPAASAAPATTLHTVIGCPHALGILTLN